MYKRQKLLNTQGYETVLLTDFGNLTDELKQYSIELVLLDINLPYENGYEEMCIRDRINEFSSDISTASLDLGTKIMLPNSDSEGKDLSLIHIFSRSSCTVKSWQE